MSIEETIQTYQDIAPLLAAMRNNSAVTLNRLTSPDSGLSDQDRQKIDPEDRQSDTILQNIREIATYQQIIEKSIEMRSEMQSTGSVAASDEHNRASIESSIEKNGLMIELAMKQVAGAVASLKEASSNLLESANRLEETQGSSIKGVREGAESVIKLAQRADDRLTMAATRKALSHLRQPAQDAEIGNRDSGSIGKPIKPDVPSL